MSEKDKSKKDIRESLDCLMSNSLNPIELAMLGAAKYCEVERTNPKIFGNLGELSRFFYKLSKNFPEFFNGIEFDGTGYSEKVQRINDRLMRSEIVERPWLDGNYYKVDLELANKAYRLLKPNQREVADELGEIFFDKMWARRV